MSWSLGRASPGLRRPPPQCGQLRQRRTCRRRRCQLCRSMPSALRCSTQLPAPRPALRRRPQCSRRVADLWQT